MSRVRAAVCAALLALLAGRAAAEHRGIPVNLGDRARSSIDAGGDVDTFVFDAFAGTRASFVLKAAKGSDLRPALEVLAPSGAPLPPEGGERRKRGKVTVRGLLLPSTGRYALRISAEEGSEGAYELRTRGSPPRNLKLRAAPLGPGETLRVLFGAATGSKVRVRVRVRGAGPCEVLSGVDPAGAGFLGGLGCLEWRGQRLGGTLFPGAGFGEYGIVLGGAGEGTFLDVTVRTRHPRVRSRRLEIDPVEPLIEEVVPAIGLEGDTVAIGGRNFTDGASQVVFGEAASSRVTFVTSTRITARVPRGELGAVDVRLYDPAGQEGVLANGFTYVVPLPTILDVSPGIGPDSGGTEVRVSGHGLDHGSELWLGDRSVASPTTSADGTTIRFTTDARSPGVVPLVVVDRWGRRVAVPEAFRFVGPPATGSVNPAAGTWRGGTEVVLSGSELCEGDRVSLDGSEVAVTWLDAGRLLFTTPSHDPGPVDVRVDDPWGRSSTLADGFEFVAGTFLDVTASRMPENAATSSGALCPGGAGLILRDVDGDSDADLVLCGATRSVTEQGATTTESIVLVLPNDGRGGFPVRGATEIVEPTPPAAAALGDLDGDGDEDLVTVSESIHTTRQTYGSPWGYGGYLVRYAVPACSTRIRLNDGKGGFTAVAGATPDPSLAQGADVLQGVAVALGDLDGDDDLDLVVCRDRAPGVSFFTTFTYWYFTSVTFRIEAGGGPATRILLNDGEGTFTDVSAKALPAVSDGDMFAANDVLLGDVDGDRDLDLVLTGDADVLRDAEAPEYVEGSKTRILTNDGSGIFTDATGSLLPAPKPGDDWGGRCLDFGDLTGDGIGDLVIGVDRELFATDEAGRRKFLPSTRVLAGRAAGGFAEATSVLPAVRSDGRGDLWRAADLAIADPDGDGDPGLFLVSRSEVTVLDPATGKFDRAASSTRWLLNPGSGPLVDFTESGLPDPADRGDRYPGDALGLADVDGDGDLDLVVSTVLPGLMTSGKRPSRLLEFR